MIPPATSFLIHAPNRGAQENRKLRHWVETGKRLGMSTVAWAELLCEPLTLEELEFASEVVKQFTDDQAVIATRPFIKEKAAESGGI